MGAYLCIATNGVPPTVSKRITVDVECKFADGIYITSLFYHVYIYVYISRIYNTLEKIIFLHLEYRTNR